MTLAADLKAAVLQAALKGELTERICTDTPICETLKQIQEEKRCLLSTGKIKEEKPLPEIDDSEIPFPIPDEWCWKRWGDISFSIQYGYNAPALTGGRIKMVRISDIQGSSVKWDTVPYCDISEKEIETYCLAVNDILFARTGGTVGKSYIVTKVPEEAIYAGYLIRTRYSEKLVPQYLKYFMESELYWNQLRNGTKISAQPNCNGKTLSRMIIPIPPIEEQQRIVDRINELMPTISEYEKMEKCLLTLKEAFPGNLRDAVLQAAVLGQLTEQGDGEDSAYFVDEIMATKKQMLAENVINRDNSCKTQPIDESDIDLPEIPSNWTWARLGNLCSKIGAGSTPSGGSKVYVKSGIKFLREQNIHNSGLVTEGLVYITDEVNSSMKGSQVKAKDILVNITGASIGRNALVPDDFDAANVNQHVLIVRLIDDRLRHYIHQCLQSPFIFNQMMDKQMGDKPGLSATKVANFLTPIPPLAEQQRIVERLDAILPLCDTLAEEI